MKIFSPSILRRAVPLAMAIGACSVLTSCVANAADELLTLEPGITRRNQKPRTWEIDLARLDGAKAQGAVAKISSHLYGTGSDLHAPLVIATNYETPKFLGFRIGDVVRKGATLRVKSGEQVVWEKRWKKAGKIHQVDTIYYLALPTGPNKISLEVTDEDGIVEIGALYVADSAAQLPEKSVNVADSDKAVKAGLVVSEAKPNQLGGLFLDKEAFAAKGIVFDVALQNNGKTARQIELRAVISNDRGLNKQVGQNKVSLATGATTRVPLALAVDQYGYFDLDILAGDEVLYKTAFCVLHQPVPGLQQDSMMGMVTRGRDEKEDQWIASRIGVKWRRGIAGGHLTEVQPKEGVWWTQDKQKELVDNLKSARALGLETVMTLHANHPWNAKIVDGVPYSKPWQVPPEDMQLHAKTVAELARVVSPYAHVYESWNEPGGHFWDYGTEEEYRELLDVLSKTVKKASPDNQLIAGSHFFGTSRKWMYPEKERANFDAIAPHNYFKPNLNSMTTVALERGMLKNWSDGRPNSGIWVTEGAAIPYRYFTKHPVDQQFLMQARSIAPMYLQGRYAAQDLDYKFFWFASAFGRPGMLTEKKGGGLLRSNIWNGEVPTANLAAYSTLARFTENTKVIGDLFASSRRAWAIAMERKDGAQVVALWPESPWPEVAGFDYQSSDLAVSTWTLPRLDFEVYDYQGRRVDTGTGATFQFQARTQEAYFLISRKSRAEVAAAVRAATFGGVAPVRAMPQPLLTPVARDVAVRFRVRNDAMQPRDIEVNVQLGAPDALKTSAQIAKAVAPGEERLLSFPINNLAARADNSYPVKYTVRSDGYEKTDESALQVAYIPRKTVKVDGDLSEWKDQPFTTIQSPQELADWGNTKPSMLRDGGYRVALSHDATNLYVAAEIADQTSKHDEDLEIEDLAYNLKGRDRLEFGFNLIKDKTYGFFANDEARDKGLAIDTDYIVEASLAPSETNPKEYVPSVFMKLSPSDGYMFKENRIPGSQANITYNAEKGRYIYEVAIPLSSIPQLQRAIAQGQSTIAMDYMVVDGHRFESPTRFTEVTDNIQIAGGGMGVMGSPNFKGVTTTRIKIEWGIGK